MKKLIKNIVYIIGVSSLVFIACKDDIAPIVEELNFNRVFTPTELTARIRNMTTVELNWAIRDDANSYVVEFSEDSLEFGTIINTVNVNPEELPFQYTLDGETQYSVRVKGLNENGIEDSKWAMIAFKTDAENILRPVADEDIQATSVVIKWPAGEEATHFLINPDGTERQITEQEITAGEATITELSGETEYTVTMHKGTKQRGSVIFTTLVDLEGVIEVHPEDDLSAIIASAGDGDELILYPGEYLAYQGSITLNKSISIKGLLPHDKPIIYVQFMLEDGIPDIEISDIEMVGEYIDATTTSDELLDYAFKYNSADVSFGSLIVKGCIIHNYKKSLVSTGSNAFSLELLLIDNCTISNIYNDGGDFIDFRMSYVANLTISNSTLVNIATVNTRDFIRMDGSTKDNTYDDGTRTPEIEVSNCTMYNIMNSASSMKRFFYIRWSQHTLKSKNNLFANMGVSIYSNQPLTLQPECSYNNYFNADGYFTDVAGVKIDNSSNYTTLDPGFVDADNGNFTITNQTLLDNSVGDPRWRGF